MNIIGTTGGLPLWNEVEIRRVTESGTETPLRDSIIVEHRMEVWLDGREVAVLSCTPDLLGALAVGHLLAQGLVASADRILTVEIADDGTRADVRLFPEDLAGVETPTPQESRFPPEKGSLEEKTSLPAPNYVDIFRQARLLYENTELFPRTGAAHSASLSFGGETIYSAVDVSRHNAVDKVIGLAAMDGRNLGEAVLMTSGRIPLDMMEKIICAGIPAVCSRSAPTTAALDLARRGNVTLIGFVREGRMNVYHRAE